MNAFEYNLAKKRLEKFRHNVDEHSLGTKEYNLALQKFLETLITVKGNAWCMDVASERKKLSKLIAGVIIDL